MVYQHMREKEYQGPAYVTAVRQRRSACYAGAVNRWAAAEPEDRKARSSRHLSETCGECGNGRVQEEKLGMDIHMFDGLDKRDCARAAL